MIICSRCKTENNESSKFCCQCGNDLTINVDAPASEDLKNLANSLNEQAVHTEKQPFICCRIMVQHRLTVCRRH